MKKDEYAMVVRWRRSKVWWINWSSNQNCPGSNSSQAAVTFPYHVLYLVPFSSFDVIEMLNSSILDPTKKRKLQSELFGLPAPKHTCLSRDATPSSTSEGYPELGHIQPNIIAKAKDEDVSSQPESAEGSNSFMEESTSNMSVSTELHTASSSSDVAWGCNSSEDQTYSSDGKETQEMEIRADEDIGSLNRDGPINLRQILEEQLLEFGNHTDYNGNDMMQQPEDNETENITYSNGTKPNSFVLSSGRWNVERGNTHLTPCSSRG